MNAIFHRISVRKYEDKPIEREKTEQLLRAAMAAPSAGNQQPWEFYRGRRQGDDGEACSLQSVRRLPEERTGIYCRCLSKEMHAAGVC